LLFLLISGSVSIDYGLFFRAGALPPGWRRRTHHGIHPRITEERLAEYAGENKKKSKISIVFLTADESVVKIDCGAFRGGRLTFLSAFQSGTTKR